MNREFARRLFHSDQAVGRTFKNRFGLKVQIVGLVEDGKYLFLSEDPQPAAYFPISQEAGTVTALIVRSQRDTVDLATGIRKVVRDLDPSIPIRASGAWYSQLAMSFFPFQVATVALGLFGVFGLLLSIAGTFGLASYTVSKRLRELSLRVALGADARHILSTALGRMLILLASGSAVGMVLGMATSRVLSAMRLPCFHAGSICAFCCCIYYGAHRIALGSWPGETRAPGRSCNPTPRTMIVVRITVPPRVVYRF